MVSDKPATSSKVAKMISKKTSSEEMSSARFNQGVALRPTTRTASMKPRAITADVAAWLNEEAPLNTKPDTSVKYTARKISSNMMMPRIISVSGLAVRLRSTSTLATIALEEMVVIPAATNISRSGQSISQ